MKNKKDYSNLDITFKDEENAVNKRFEIANKFIPENTTTPKNLKRVSISVQKEDVDFVLKVRKIATDLNKNFYPSVSSIYRAAIAKLKELNDKEIKELILSN